MKYSKINHVKKVKHMKYAVIVVDMLNDFVTGALRCERGIKMVPHCVELVEYARKKHIPVIFTNDAHLDKVDREFKVWGPHALVGTTGAEVIPELKLDHSKDYVINKRRYSGFFQTDLDALLRELGVDTVIMCGLHAHMCVRHTSADAFQLGYDVIAATECMDSFTKEDYEIGIKYLHDVYGAPLLTNKEIKKLF